MLFITIIAVMLVFAVVADTNIIAADINTKCKNFDLAVITAKDEFLADLNERCGDVKDYAMDKALVIDCAAKVNRKVAMKAILKKNLSGKDRDFIEKMAFEKAIIPPTSILGLVSPEEFAKLT